MLNRNQVKYLVMFGVVNTVGISSYFLFFLVFWYMKSVSYLLFGSWIVSIVLLGISFQLIEINSIYAAGA